MATPQRGQGNLSTNPINKMKQWAAHCEKELRTADTWLENWGEVYFPGEKKTDMDARLEELERKAKELDARVKKAQEDRAKINLETFASPHKRAGSGLRPAYPYV